MRAGTEAARLSGVCDILDRKVGLYSLVYDEVQPFNSVKCSIGVGGITCEDVSARNRGKEGNLEFLFVVPSGQDVNLNSVLRGPAAEFTALGRAGTRVHQRVPAAVGAANAVAGGDGAAFTVESYTQYAYLVCVVADSIARIALGCFVGLASLYGACCWCMWTAKTVNGTTRFLGYNEAQPQPRWARRCRSAGVACARTCVRLYVCA